MTAVTAIGFEYPSHRLAPGVYRRRRVLALLVFVGLVLALATMAARLGRDSLVASGPVSQVELVGRQTHVVAPGDTLWTIARAVQPEGDVRPLVQALAATRRGAPLQVGERIVIPNAREVAVAQR